MGRLALSIVGSKFGYLTVLKDIGRAKDGQVVWTCECECGNYRNSVGSDLRSGKVNHCGCRRVKTGPKTIEPRKPRVRPPLYGVWNSLMQRCYNPNRESYKDYGARGITVSTEWKDYKNFYRDMAPRPEGMSIEREDTNKGYSKDNCIWATAKEQQDNRTTSIRFDYRGRLYTLQELAEVSGLSKETLRSRICLYKWSVEDAINKPKYSQPSKLASREVVKLY